MAIGVGRALDGSACRRPVLPPVEVPKRLLVDRRRMQRLQAEPGVPALLVRLQEETEVICLKALGATQVAGLESGNAAAHLAEQEFLGVAREAGPGRIEAPGPLVEVHGIPLGAGDGLLGPGDAAQVEGPRDLIVPAEEAVPKAPRSDMGVAPQPRMGPGVEFWFHRCANSAHAAFAVGEVLLSPPRGVVGGGLHRFAEWARGALR